MGTSHIMIPDMQVKPGLDLDYCRWAGEYVARRQPDCIINIGDFADMESLSSYDKGKKGFEGRRYTKDIEAAHRAMDTFMEPIARVPGGWDPNMVMTMGNHEERILRVGELTPELDEVVSYKDLAYEEWGWDVYDYQVPVDLDGIWYSHMFVNPESLIRSAMTGTMDNRLRKIGRSFSQGHQQGLLYGVKYAGGRVMHGLVAGSYYEHDEKYMGPQGNDHWRGLVVKHQVRDGQYDPMFVGLDYLRDRFKRKKR